MPKFKIKTFIAFVLLGLLIYAFRNAHGNVFEYLVAIPCIGIFWYLLGLQFALSNLRNVLLLTFIFGTIIFVFRVIFPITGPVGTMGMLQGFDLNPEKIGLLKESHEIALEIHLDHRPILKDRYFKIGDLLYTADGLHYSNKKQSLNFSSLPKTAAWVNAHLAGNALDRDANKVQSWFVKSMTYTLSPGTLNSSMPLDQFIFERRAGFCEHFAASLSTILQLKGYQSRVAYGYAGGSWDPILKILTFENADAHAWVEAFDPRIKQYKIIDPTSWIFPEVSRGRTMGMDPSWIFLTVLVLSGLSGIFLLRQGSGVDRFFIKVAHLEKKYSLDSKGLTLSERISRLAQFEQALKEKMFISLKVYLKMYSFQGSLSQHNHTLKKSLSAW